MKKKSKIILFIILIISVISIGIGSACLLFVNSKNKSDTKSSQNNPKTSLNQKTKETSKEPTKSPVLTLKELTIKEGDTYNIDSFIASCTTATKDKCELSFSDNAMATYTKEGTYEITIIATDTNENKESAKTKLIITSKENKEDSKKEKTIKDNNNTKTEANENNSKNETTKNNSNNTPTKTETTTKTEDVTTTTTKYGVKITKIEKVTYEISSNGTKKEISRVLKSTDYTYNTFKATTEELMPEAKSNAQKYAQEINEVLKYVNEYRKEVGASPLKLDTSLVNSANVRSMEQAYTNKMSHTRPDGTDCFTVNEKAYAENVAYGYSTPKAVSEGWKNSSGHYANMVNKGYKTIGIGVYNLNGTYYWTQLFGF